MNAFFRKLTFGFFIGATLGLSACTKDEDTFDAAAQLEKEVTAIDNYLAQNNVEAVKDITGVRMVITELGTGLPAELNNTIKIDYVGNYFSNGTEFDKGTDKSWVLNSLINGWKIAFTTLPKGSKAKLYIPSGWAYGPGGYNGIPGNATLTFDVDFKDITYTTSYKEKLKTDTVAIDDYLNEKGIEAVKDPSGIRYVITQEGTGATATWYDKLKLKFSFKLLTDDTKTLATLEREPNEGTYSRVVDYLQGMKVGLQKMNEGSKATLYIPSGLGFGATGITGSTLTVPANANLIVDVELIDIVQ